MSDHAGVVDEDPDDRVAGSGNGAGAELHFWERACLGMDCARGLAHLHANHRLHRDIKSFNILCDVHPSQQRIAAKLGDYGTVKILATEEGDTGLSMFEAKTSELTMERGTMGWVSPEVLGGIPGQVGYGPPADIFSLGVVLWELIAEDVHANPLLGRAPVDYCNRLERGERPTVNVGVPAAYRELLYKCWAFKPDDRPTA